MLTFIYIYKYTQLDMLKDEWNWVNFYVYTLKGYENNEDLSKFESKMNVTETNIFSSFPTVKNVMLIFFFLLFPDME